MTTQAATQDEPHAFYYQWSTSNQPLSVALDPTGTVAFVTTWGIQHGVQKYDTSGYPLAEWGLYGREGEYWFSHPRDIAVDSLGNVYIADMDNNRIQKYDSDGNFLLMWGYGVSTGALEFEICQGSCRLGRSGGSGGVCDGYPVVQPRGIGVDSSDNVWVANGCDRVQKFDSQGNYLFQFGSTGSGSGQFNVPATVTFDSLGYAYVGDWGNSRIQKFDGSGNFLLQWPRARGAAIDIAVDAHDYVYVASGRSITKHDPVGNLLTTWGGIGDGEGKFREISGLAIDNVGFIYVTDIVSALVQVFSPPADVHHCSGFQPPMASDPVTARGNRALPLKARLFDVDGYEMTDLELTVPPVLQVMFQSDPGGTPVDVTGDALPAGHGTDGNEFEYNLADQLWQYNLKTKDYSAAGTYTITMVSGDDAEYVIEPTCEATFKRQE